MTWPQDAYVGQKVVCIHNYWDNSDGSDLPIKGKIYEILSIQMGATLLGFHLKGVRCFNIYGYAARQFRPAQSTEKGMAILKEILVTQKVKEDA